MPYWATIPVAGAVCLVAGFLFGLPALRLEGLYLALATFALGVAMPQILKHKALEHWTGGVQGIVIVKPDAARGIAAARRTSGSTSSRSPGSCVLFVARLEPAARAHRPRDGRDPRPAHRRAGDGRRTPRSYKSLTFGVSALYTGIAGALGAIAVQFVAPDSFTIFLSLTLLVGVVVGGLASISGAFYGALFIQFVPNIADQISKAAPWAIYGVFLIAFMYADAYRRRRPRARMVRAPRWRAGGRATHPTRRVDVQSLVSRKEAG